MSMARLVVFFALCVLPALVTAARPAKNPFNVVGRVYCDTCRAGFETPATTYIPGARVRVECRDRDNLNLLFSVEGVTDATGTYNIQVAEDHGDQLCEAVLVRSSQEDCGKIESGRERANVVLTRNNGVLSDKRFANNMGFIKDQPLAGCAEILKQYQSEEYEN
ncbi:PREDICTED: pollen-specific protein C13-like [Nelumbo nucifera]|uniref:Pollen-specific protein C13-like n=1 Tax=Nelumbo nucifera TaxID=4432 RepID=A0A1U8A2I9_NELNU|nr:PREDICTED: pollen-specific protein C13-like [Nelumbo nucifera]